MKKTRSSRAPLMSLNLVSVLVSCMDCTANVCAAAQIIPLIESYHSHRDLGLIRRETYGRVLPCRVNSVADGALVARTLSTARRTPAAHPTSPRFERQPM